MFTSSACCSICLTRDPCQDTQYHNWVEVIGNSLWLDSHHRSISMLLGTPRAIIPGTGVIYWSMKCTSRMGESLCTLGKRVLLNLHRDSIILLQAGPVEMYYTWNGPSTIGRGKKTGALLWNILPPFISSWLNLLPLLTNVFDMYNEVKFLKFPASLSSRTGGHILFPTDTFFWLPFFFPSIVMEAITAHIEALITFTQ